MVHRTQIINGIGTQKCVYRHLRLGNLDRTQTGNVVSFVPLQDRFYSDSKGSLSVAVYNLTTPTFIDGIVFSGVSSIDCTAVGTPFGSMISVNFVKGGLEHFAVGFKKSIELSVRNFANLLVGFPVELSSFTSDIFQFLNRNVSIIRFGKIYNSFGNLTASCLDKISLLDSKLSQTLSRPMRTFVGKAFEISSSFYKSLLLFGDIPAKVKLLDNFGSLYIKNRCRSKGRRAYVNADNISLINFLFGKFLLKNNRNSAILKERNIVKSPTIIKKIGKSLKLVVSFNGNHKGFSWRISDFKAWVSSFRFDISEPSLIEAYRAFIKFKVSVIARLFNALSIFPSVFSGFLNNVAWQKGGLSYA